MEKPRPNVSQDSSLSISSVVLGELVDKSLFIPLVIGLVALVDLSTTLFSVLALLLGSLCTLAGAYYAANRAKRAFITHAMLVAALTFAISFIRFLFAQSSDEPSIHPLWWEFVSWGFVFISGYIGGFLAQNRAQSANA